MISENTEGLGNKMISNWNMSNAMAKFLIRNYDNKIVRGFVRAFPGILFRYFYTAYEESLPWTDKKVSFCLSFDCDFEEDASILPELQNILRRNSIKSAFAVIGELVSKNPNVYQRLIKDGHEIINHGYSEHNKKNKHNEYISTGFYHEMSKVKIEEEIVRNHDYIKNTLDYEMVGFRTPHFGTFQKKEQSDYIHAILANLGYQYSSSTTAFSAFEYGLYYYKTAYNTWEFPLTGCLEHPSTTFDSWHTFSNPNRVHKDSDFFKIMKKIIDISISANQPIFLNFYFDPIYSYNFEGFIKSIEYLSNKQDKIWIGQYQEIVQTLSKR